MSEEKITNEAEEPIERVGNEAEQASVQEEKKETKKTHSFRRNKKEDELEKAQNELLSLKDKHIRLQAEFDNFRKRTLKEKMELIKSAGESILVNILPVIDDFDRALQLMGETNHEDPMVGGVNLIYNKFQEFLKQNGIKEIEANKMDFDTDLHEAITKVPAPSDELKGKIVAVVQKGYLLNDKVIRFSKVVIGE